ncbi:D-aminoacyl-tRNA deacylase [Vallitalea okinawensis]|uniref:D-aminoacyl-tRNA deacylase n=1 Tax=Vallitalea okinawensis TaxID=2078660 RepID=UPI000CFCA7F2|nr:D-aminoacyl-tRNA deacylase [Vallitalea okinawensis]
MRAVIQRVSHAQVVVEDQIIGKIEKGIMVLVGFKQGDDEKTMEYMLEKITKLRIFEDENDKMNLSLSDVKGGLLIVPNFTLYGDCRKGRRPSYSTGAPVVEAEGLFNQFIDKAKESYVTVQTGQFRAHMEVTLTNDGPVTLLLDSDKEF